MLIDEITFNDMILSLKYLIEHEKNTYKRVSNAYNTCNHYLFLFNILCSDKIFMTRINQCLITEQAKI